MTTTANPALALQELGFTALEAQVYVYLLRHEPSTGYRISHAIGKPTANTYKALASLAGQGAVLVDDGGSGAARAVPVEELLSGLDRRGREQRAAARAALADMTPGDDDDRVYALKDPAQVVERARAMLARAGQIVLADLFPATFALLREDLIACAARGVRVVVRAYAAAEATGVLVVAAEGKGAPGGWPGQQLSLVADGNEHLLALLSMDLASVHQAVWSRSAFLSCLQHNHVAMELLYTAREATGVPGVAAPDLADITVLAADPAGLRRLRDQVAGDPSSASPVPAIPMNPDDNAKGVS